MQNKKMPLVPSSGRTSLDCRAWTADLILFLLLPGTWTADLILFLLLPGTWTADLIFLLLPGTWTADCLEYLLHPDRWEVISAPSLFPESSATFPKFAFNPDGLQLA